VLEEAERQMFGRSRAYVNEYLADFEKADTKSKRFSLRLLRQAIEESPQAVQKIIQDVLDSADREAR